MNKNIVIVGIGGSLGSALEKHFDSQKAIIYGTSSKKNVSSENLFYLDFMDNSSIDSFPDFPIDHLIICAGYEPKYNLAQTNQEHIEKMFRIHVIGPMLLLKKVQNNFTADSSVTFISSVAAYQGSYDPSYSAVKGAINSLIRTFAKDFAPCTRVNGLAPSLIDDSTVFFGMTEDFKQNHLERTLNKRFLSQEECCEAIDFIIKAKHYTGQVLHLNGGTIYG